MADYLFLMESRVSPEQWQLLTTMQTAAGALNINVYLAGGAIRDLIAGLPIDNLDFVLEGKALKLLPQLTKHGAEVLWKNDAVQSAELQFPAGVLASVSMARSETYPKPGAGPVVSPAGIIQDLRRRDFPMNSIAIPLNPNSRGLLLDPTNGLADIEKKEIRAQHNYTFFDDPARMFRAVRLRTRLGFNFDPKTAAQFQNARNEGTLEHASSASLAQEMRRLARERNPVDVLKALDKEKLLATLSPRLQGSTLDWQALARVSKASHLLAAAGIRAPSYQLFIYNLSAKIPAKERSQFLQRIQFGKADWSIAEKRQAEAKRMAKEIAGRAGGSPTKLFQLLSKAPADVFLLLLSIFPQSAVQNRLKAYLTKYLPLRLHPPEQELQQVGFKPGTPRYHKAVDAYFFASIEGELRTPNQQQKFIHRLAQETK